MANTSILAAFERMWQHVVNAIESKMKNVETSLSTQIDERANGIIVEASGDSIELSDSVQSPLRSFTLYGKTSLSGTPSVDAPVSVINTSSYIHITTSSGTDSQQQLVYVMDGLAGIPVNYNGNYTDENGQKWICDEINSHGTLTRRLYKVEFTGSETVSGMTGCFLVSLQSLAPSASSIPYQNACICSHYIGKTMSATGDIQDGYVGAYGGFWFGESRFTTPEEFKSWLAAQYNARTPVTVVYAIDNTNSVQSEYIGTGNLCTYYPNTLITNDASAGMHVQYQTDTKTYIDLKIAEVSNAILNNT